MSFQTIAQLTSRIAAAFAPGSQVWRGQTLEDLLKDTLDSTPIVNGLSLGLVADGTTDNSTVLATALSTNKFIYLPAGNYAFTTKVTVPAGCKIEGSGHATRLIWNTNDTLFALGSNCHISSMWFSRASGGGSSQRFIKWDDEYSNMVEGCFFEDSQGAGVSFTGLIDGTQFSDGSHIQNCIFIGCTRGIYSEVRGEYVNIVNCSACRCGTGMELNGGNTSIVGCNINSNGTGVKITGGANNGHCVVSGTKINHNGAAIDMDSVSNGHRFDGCDIYYGTISIVNCAQVSFNGCDFSDNAITVTNSPNTSFVDARYITNVTWTVTGSYISQLYADRTFTPSATADTAGRTGDIAWDASFVYVKTAAGWKRSALTTF